MIKIDERLKKIADMICGDTIADIGSDHAYLPIWLYCSEKIKKAYALDISANCIEKIKKNIEKYNIPKNAVIPVISDGLSCFGQEFDLNELSDIVIAGMGGETIAEIIKKSKNIYDISKINFVLQPNSKIVFLKNFLNENDFKIKNCAIIESKKRLYNIINAEYTGIKR